MQSVSLLNAQRKRQRRQAAGALVTGLFAGGHSNQSASGAAAIPPEAQSVAPIPQIITPGPASSEKKSTKKKSTAQPRPEIQIPPRGFGPIYEPNENDVLCGRGGRINAHPGNVRFRAIVVLKKKEYLAPRTQKLEKAHIAADVVRDIRAKDPPGRFLKEDPNGAWYDIGDAKAIKKVGQALREDAPDIRDELGSDEEKEGETGEQPPVHKVTPQPAEHSKTQSPSPASVPLPPQPLATVTIGAATAVSGRGAKVITTQSSQRSVASQQSKGSYASFQPILPPTHEHGPSKLIFPGIRGRGAVSGAAAAAMSHSEDGNPTGFTTAPTPDVAFGRHFHEPDAERESSMASGLSANTGANPSALSGMSGISALTDPLSTISGDAGEFQQPMGRPRRVQQATSQAVQQARPQTVQQFQAMRYNQLQQLRQPWAHGSQRVVESVDMRSLGSFRSLGSLQRSRSWQENTMNHQLRHSDNMSWADHSLLGGGINDVNSVMSGQQSFHSYYLRDQAMGPSDVFPARGASNLYMESPMMDQGSPGDQRSPGVAVAPMFRLAGISQMQPQQVLAPVVPSPAQMYYGSSSGEDNSAKTNPTARGGGGGGGSAGGGSSIASMSMASASIIGSIMSDLSENLIALDLAEPRLLDRIDGNL